jgi:hypothetical protein
MAEGSGAAQFFTRGSVVRLLVEMNLNVGSHLEFHIEGMEKHALKSGRYFRQPFFIHLFTHDKQMCCTNKIKKLYRNYFFIEISKLFRNWNEY